MSGPTRTDLHAFVQIAEAMADAAASVTLDYFRQDSLETSNKDTGGGFDPVTLADQGAERAMRDVLARERPDDGIFGEEFDRKPSDSGFTWILDPIDGTRAFISGLPVWGTLIGLDDGQQGVVGIVDQPYMGERYIGCVDGDGSKAWRRHGEKQRDIKVRACQRLHDAVLFTTDPYLFEGAEAPAFAALRAAARLTRYGTDCYAYALLAAGQIDLVVESGLNAYDIASHVPLIRAAGGIVTDWQGGDCRWGGRVIAAGDARVHAEVLDILSKID